MKFRQAIPVFLFCCLLLLNFNSVDFAQTVKLPDGVTKITSIEGVNEYRLANGLQVLLIPDQASQNVLVNIVYRVGSRHEGYGETGMAHLLEHLLFKGTPKYGNIPTEISKRGMQANATTSLDRTNYFATFAPTAENLEFYLDLEADRMINSYVAKKDLDSEMTVVRNEMENGENNATRVLLQNMFATAYQWHNYGKTTIGARSDVENVRIENLQAFYRKFYQTDNATLIIGGKIDEARTLQIIKDKFGVLAKPTRILEPTWTDDPAQDGERQIVVRRVGGEQLLMVGYHVPPSAHPDMPAISIMERVLADPASGVLFKALVETKKAISIGGSTFQQKEPGYNFYVARLSKEQSLVEVENLLTTTLENFAKTMPAKEEVERHKTAAAKISATLPTNTNTLASAFTEYVARGDWRLFYKFRDDVKKVTPEDVQRVAKTYLLSSNRTVAKYIPTENPLRVDILRMTDDQILAVGNQVKSGETVAQGEVFEATYANIEARAKRGQISGIQTAFLSKTTRGNLATARFDLNLGDEKSLQNLNRIGSYTAAMLMNGTAKRTKQQLKDELDRLQATITVTGGATLVSVTITAKQEKFAEAMKITAEILKEPAFPEADFEQSKKAALAAVETGKTDPQAIATRELRRAFNTRKKGEIGYAGTVDEEIAEINAVTLDQLKKFHKEFYGTSSSKLAITGEFNETEVSALVKDLFGSWKSPKPYTRIGEKYQEFPGRKIAIETPDKANAVYIARSQFRMRDDNPDYPALVIGNFIMGGGFLNSRLATRIRQKDGISYSVGSSFSVSSLDETGGFLIQGILAPENETRFETAIREEIQKIVTEGYTEKEVTEAKQGWLLSRRRNIGNDAVIRASLLSFMTTKRNFTWEEAMEKKVENLTVEQINAAMKKYLNLDNFVVIKAGDFAKAKAKANQ
jgi:zinc protease